VGRKIKFFKKLFQETVSQFLEKKLFFHSFLKKKHHSFLKKNCEKRLADVIVSCVFQKYFNFVPILESRNVDHVNSYCSWDMFLWKISGDDTLSSVFQKYFNFVPMLQLRNVDHVKSNCSWDIFSWKKLGGLHTFMNFSKIFQLCTHARIT